MNARRNWRSEKAHVSSRSAILSVWFIPRLSIGSWWFIGYDQRRRGRIVADAVSDVAGARPVRQYAGVAIEFVADDDVELADGFVERDFDGDVRARRP